VADIAQAACQSIRGHVKPLVQMGTVVPLFGAAWGKELLAGKMQISHARQCHDITGSARE
jgi:hypothetical protein